MRGSTFIASYRSHSNDYADLPLCLRSSRPSAARLRYPSCTGGDDGSCVAAQIAVTDQPAHAAAVRTALQLQTATALIQFGLVATVSLAPRGTHNVSCLRRPDIMRFFLPKGSSPPHRTRTRRTAPPPGSVQQAHDFVISTAALPTAPAARAIAVRPLSIYDGIPATTALSL